jgi:hypothetical protein
MHESQHKHATLPIKRRKNSTRPTSPSKLKKTGMRQQDQSKLRLRSLPRRSVTLHHSKNRAVSSARSKHNDSYCSNQKGQSFHDNSKVLNKKRPVDNSKLQEKSRILDLEVTQLDSSDGNAADRSGFTSNNQ